MLVIAGLSLKNLKPRVWDPESEYYLPQLKAVMVSYAEFHMLPARRKQAMKLGLHKYLGVPDGIKV
jgi:7-cyano-7-deazaguanine tRNA-ribosyltransferase